MRGFAQPTTYVVIIMKNFLTAIASALLVAVIVTSLHYFVFSNDLDRAPMALFVLSFLGMAAVALFNVRLDHHIFQVSSSGASQAAMPKAMQNKRAPAATMQARAKTALAKLADGAAKTHDPPKAAEKRAQRVTKASPLQPRRAPQFQMVPVKMAP